MKYFLCLVFSYVCMSADAQFGLTEYTKYFTTFKEGKVLVVKTGDETYDRLMTEAFTKYWTVNNFALVDLKDVKNNAPDPAIFYVTTAEVTGYYGTVNYTVFKLFLTNQLQFDKEDKLDYLSKKMNWLATAQFDKSISDEEQLKELYIQAELIKGVQLMNNHCNFVLTEKPKKHYGTGDYLHLLGMKNKQLTHQYPILFTTETLQKELHDANSISKIYKYPFKIVSIEDVYRSIINQTDDVYVHFYMDGNLTFKTLIQAKNSKILFGEVTTGSNQEKIKPAYIKRVNAL